MIDVVIIYNHKFISNIDKLERYYANKFRKIWHIVPFYQGNVPNVISVYDGSFQFQSFIAHAASRLMIDPPDQFLFLADDLLLDPKINQNNILSELGMNQDDGFIGELHDLSKGRYGRGVTEARKVNLQHPGLEIGGELPLFEDAQKRLNRHLKIDSLILRKYTPYTRHMAKPWLDNIKPNWKMFRGNVWHQIKLFEYWSRPKILPYPLLGGYADIFIIPSPLFKEFSHYCGVFSAARIFVEIAIPTAMALVCNRLVTEEMSPRRGFNVWFPPETWQDMESKMNKLSEIQSKVDNKLSNLIAEWPDNYLYLHPLKLSKWSWD